MKPLFENRKQDQSNRSVRIGNLIQSRFKVAIRNIFLVIIYKQNIIQLHRIFLRLCSQSNTQFFMTYKFVCMLCCVDMWTNIIWSHNRNMCCSHIISTGGLQWEAIQRADPNVLDTYLFLTGQWCCQTEV